MIELLQEIKSYFDNKTNYFNIFSKVDTRVEGWFKAEILLLLEKLLSEKKIKAYQRELNIHKIGKQRNSIDFEIDFLTGQKVLLELKAISISQNMGTPRNLNFYFRPDQVGIIKDFKKLDSLNYNGDKYIIGFIYPKPTNEKWIEAKNKISGDCVGWTCISNIDDYSVSYFMSVWKRNIF